VASEYHLKFLGKIVSKARFFRGFWPEKQVVDKYPFICECSLKNIGKEDFQGAKIEEVEIYFGGRIDGIKWKNDVSLEDVPFLAPDQSHPFTFTVPCATQAGPAVLCLKVSSEDGKRVIIHQTDGGVDKNDPQVVRMFFVADESALKNHIYTRIALLLALGALITNVFVGVIQICIEILIAKGVI